MVLVCTELQCPVLADAPLWTPLLILRTGNVLNHEHVRDTNRAILGSCNFVRLLPSMCANSIHLPSCLISICIRPVEHMGMET